MSLQKCYKNIDIIVSYGIIVIGIAEKRGYICFVFFAKKPLNKLKTGLLGCENKISYTRGWYKYMSREYAKRSRGGGNLPLIIAIVGTVIVVAVIIYFLVGNNGGIGSLSNKETATPEATFTPVQNSPTPSATPAPTQAPTIQLVSPSETVSASVATQAPTPTPAPNYKTATVWANALNVREGPGLDYSVVGSVKRNQTFKVLEETSKFLKIQLTTGAYGWIWADYCVRGDAALPAAPTSEPDPSMMKSAKLTNNTTIHVEFTENVWGNAAKTSAVQAAAFEVKEGSSTVAISAITLCQGGTYVDLTIGATSGGTLKVTLKEDGVYNTDSEGTNAGSVTLGDSTDSSAPTVSFGVTSNVVTVTFSEGVYSTNSKSGALDKTDFAVSGNNGTLTYEVAHTAGSKTASVTITYGGLSTGDQSNTAVTLYSSSAYDAAGNACASGTTNFTYTAP